MEISNLLKMVSKSILMAAAMVFGGCLIVTKLTSTIIQSETVAVAIIGISIFFIVGKIIKQRNKVKVNA